MHQHSNTWERLQSTIYLPEHCSTGLMKIHWSLAPAKSSCSRLEKWNHGGFVLYGPRLLRNRLTSIETHPLCKITASLMWFTGLMGAHNRFCRLMDVGATGPSIDPKNGSMTGVMSKPKAIPTQRYLCSRKTYIF